MRWRRPGGDSARIGGGGGGGEREGRGGDGGGGMLTVAYQISSDAVELNSGAMTKLLSAAAALQSDPLLGSVWLPVVAYLTLFAMSLLVQILCHPSSAPPRLLSQRRHQGKFLAAAYLLRVLTQAFRAWCGVIALRHLQAAVPAGLKLFKRKPILLPCSLQKNR